MYKQLILCVCSAMVMIVGCAGQEVAQGPLMAQPFAPAPQTLIWHGVGQVERFEGGRWVRVPAHDYELTVVQRRYQGRWESTKEMHRRHPDYDESAGPRHQSHHFTIAYGEVAQGQQAFTVGSTMGQGSGLVDVGFKRAKMKIKAEVSRFAPFDAYVLEQSYLYEQGRLEETVTLVDEREGGKAWVRIAERATLFRAGVISGFDSEGVGG